MGGKKVFIKALDLIALRPILPITCSIVQSPPASDRYGLLHLLQFALVDFIRVLQYIDRHGQSNKLTIQDQ